MYLEVNYKAIIDVISWFLYKAAFHREMKTFVARRSVESTKGTLT